MHLKYREIRSDLYYKFNFGYVIEIEKIRLDLGKR